MKVWAGAPEREKSGITKDGKFQLTKSKKIKIRNMTHDGLGGGDQKEKNEFEGLGGGDLEEKGWNGKIEALRH